MKKTLFNTRQAVQINDLPARASGLTSDQLDQLFGGFNWWAYYCSDATAPEYCEYDIGYDN